MEFNLKQYRKKISEKLIDDIKNKNLIDNNIQQGKKQVNKMKKQTDKNIKLYEDKFEEPTQQKLNMIKRNVRRQTQRVNDYLESDDEGNDTENENLYQGGKIHFLKSLKKVGKTMSKDLNTAGKTFKNTAIKTGATLAGQEAGTYLYNGLKTVGKTIANNAAAFGEEALPIAEAYGPEIAEAAVVAAGMKKPKQKRQQSQKQINRGLLIKKLMNKHNISLPEASQIIKANNLKY